MVFKDEQPVQNFFTKEIYSLKIENWVCRILPADHTHAEHDKRSKFGYKITGLPMNTQLGNLYPILTRINAQTCTFAPTNNRQLQKLAYVYVKEKDYKEQIFRIKCFNTIIYVFSQTIRLSCMICRDPTHKYTACPNKKRIIRMDQNKHQNFKQPAPSNQLSIYTPHISDNSSKINRLEQEINALKTQLKTLAEENTSLKKELKLVKDSITTNTKELLYMKEQLNHVNTKSDIMIQKLEEISLHHTTSLSQIVREDHTNSMNIVNTSYPTTTNKPTSHTNNNIPAERQRKIQIVTLPNYNTKVIHTDHEGTSKIPSNAPSKIDTYINIKTKIKKFTKKVKNKIPKKSFNKHESLIQNPDITLSYHTASDNTTNPFTNGKYHPHTSKTHKNKNKNFHKNKSSSHIKNRIITPTHFLNVQSPRPINNADDLMTLDTINDSQDEHFNDYVKIGAINIHMDVIKHFNSSPSATHIVNRIDYIFASSNFLPHTYHAFTHNINEHQFFYTDHKLVGCLINKFFFTTKPVTLIYKKLDDVPSPDKINYQNITAQTWNDYEQHSEVIFNTPLPNINSQEDLDQSWSHFVNMVDDLKSILPKKNSPQNPYSALLKLRQAYNKVFKLQRLLQTFNGKRIIHTCNILLTKSNTHDTSHPTYTKINDIENTHWNTYWGSHWTPYYRFLLNIKKAQATNPTISSFIIPKCITLDNFETTKKYLKQFLQILRFNYNITKNEITKNNIEYFVEARNNNLTDNQSKMLYSIFNRQPRKIKLTKLQYTDKNNVIAFTTDPNKIEALTRQHFQSYASSPHSVYYTLPNNLPSPWNEIYSPR
ncbi:hypothetical protein GLOIN_2v1790299 [Rhizophagus clarus]|uniref:Uncharacterized protein n=1 Tax=Rhizophagus clarus TaxID=94130 RepID=A0A8H3R2H2_9GLOM|nr:hypothetical protein GLOIN_2v1790299 [Rhizophagus clarus]